MPVTQREHHVPWWQDWEGWGLKVWLMVEVLDDPGVRGGTMAPESNAIFQEGHCSATLCCKIQTWKQCRALQHLSCSARPGWAREMQQPCPEGGWGAGDVPWRWGHERWAVVCLQFVAKSPTNSVGVTQALQIHTRMGFHHITLTQTKSRLWKMNKQTAENELQQKLCYFSHGLSGFKFLSLLLILHVGGGKHKTTTTTQLYLVIQWQQLALVCFRVANTKGLQVATSMASPGPTKGCCQEQLLL